MAAAQLELRMAALESEMERLRQQIEKPPVPDKHWVEEIYGAFAGDDDFLEAMRLGRQYREAQRPKAKKRPVKARR
jgi:hypothetical protein